MKIYSSLQDFFYPYSQDFIFESLMPFINYNLRSQSKTLKAMGLQNLTYWAYLTQGKEHFKSLGHYSNDE